MQNFESPSVVVKDYDSMSEDEQLNVIERALHGDLKGIIDVTPKDMELYNRRYQMSRTGYVTQAEMDKRHQEWLANHPEDAARTQPVLQSNADFSSGAYQGINQNCTLNNYNPYIGGGYAPRNSYENPYGGSFNPYASTPISYGQQYYQQRPYYGYGGYYGGYPQQTQQQIANLFEDPVMRFAFSKINQISDMYNSGQMNSNNYYQMSAQQPRTETVCINPSIENNNLQVSDPGIRKHLNLEDSRKFFTSSEVKLKEFDLPYDDNEDKDIYGQIPVEANNAYRSYYSQYYSMSPLQRALNSPSPYTYTDQYREEVRQFYQNQQNLYNAIGKAVFEYAGYGDYDEYMKQKELDEKRRIADQYRQACEQDQGLTTEEKRHNSEVRRRADYLFESGAQLYRYRYCSVNPEQLRYTPQNFLMTAYRNSPELRDQYKYINPDQTFSEFVNGYNNYAHHMETVEFARNARKSYMNNYNSDSYRNAILTDNPNARNSLLGFNTVYDPVRRQTNQVIAPHAGLEDQYAAKRSAYLASAGKIRGGTGSVV